MRISIPTWITIVRFLLILPILGALYFDWVWLALLLLVVALFTDWLDGYLARDMNDITRLGTFLDHFADKLLVHLILLYFVAVHGLSAIAFGIILVRDFLVLGVRHIAAQRNTEIPSMSLGKVKFLGQGILLVVLILALQFDFVWLSLLSEVILWIVVLLSAISAVQLLKAAKHVFAGE